MPTRAHRQILKAAARGQLPESIDERSDFDVHLVRELVESGLLKAVDASSFDGPAFLNPTITVAGREYLQGSGRSRLQRWAAYATIGAFVVALASLPWWESAQETPRAGPENEVGIVQAPMSESSAADALPSEITRTFDVSETNSDHKTIGTNIDDLAAERRRLGSQGIALGDDIPGDYSTLAQLRDPDGNLITLATPPAGPFPPA